MKATRAQIERAWGTDEARLVLLYGPDESASREIARGLCSALGNVERVDLTGSELRSDPARLPDEAASISLFGDRRVIRVDPAGDDATAAAEALLAVPAAGTPVVMIAGALRKDAKLLKLALAHPLAMAMASYVPEGREADRLVVSQGEELGLRIRPEVAHRLAAAAGGDRAVLARELEKFQLFLDAAPGQTVELDDAVFEALQADASEGDLSALVDAVLLGRGPAVDSERRHLDAGGADAIPAIRALLRRLHQLAALRGDVEAGSSIDAVLERGGKAIFFKDRPALARQLALWSSADIATAIQRMIMAERELKSSGAVAVLADQALTDLTRAAARRR